MAVLPITKSIQCLSEADLLNLAIAVFPEFEKSGIEFIAREIDFALVSTHPGYALSYTQALRANQWLRAHGYRVQGLATDRAELN